MSAFWEEVNGTKPKGFEKFVQCITTKPKANLPKVEPGEETVPQSLMKNLVFPAFLGTGLVWTSSKLVHEFAEAGITGSELLTAAFWLTLSNRVEGPVVLEFVGALWLLLYFFGPFYLLDKGRGNAYEWKAFWLDMADVLLILLGFTAVAMPYTGDVHLFDNGWVWFFAVLVGIPVLAYRGNLAQGRAKKWKVSLGAIVVGVSGMIVACQCADYVWVPLLLTYLLLPWYYADLRREFEAQKAEDKAAATAAE